MTDRCHRACACEDPCEDPAPEYPRVHCWECDWAAGCFEGDCIHEQQYPGATSDPGSEED